MNSKAQYKTKQREELLAYLESVQGTHVTVNEICLYFRQLGKPIGTTTVYRHLDHMVEEGLVNKYIIDSASSACYEYIGSHEHCHQPACYHCKCEKCGQLIHLECNELAGISRHMLEHHGFEMDPLRTVFYGICETCKEKGVSIG